MPYKKKYKKRKYGGKYNRTISSLRNTAYLANQVFKLKRMINVEYKNFDIQLTNGTATSAGAIQQASNIGQGDTTITRDGNQVKALSIFFRCNVKMNASARASSVRIMLVLDKQTNGAIYTMADLLLDVTADDIITSPLNIDNKFRFKVIYDKVFSLSITGTQLINFKKYFKINLPIRFDAAAATIAAVTSNSLSIVRITDEDINLPTVTYTHRLRFVDN